MGFFETLLFRDCLGLAVVFGPVGLGRLNFEWGGVRGDGWDLGWGDTLQIVLPWEMRGRRRWAAGRPGFDWWAFWFTLVSLFSVL